MIYKYKKNYYYYYYYYYYCYYKKNITIIFLTFEKKLFFVETYKNGKPHNTRTKTNRRKKRY